MGVVNRDAVEYGPSEGNPGGAELALKDTAEGYLAKARG
jgi:hypothetical protein